MNYGLFLYTTLSTGERFEILKRDYNGMPSKIKDLKGFSFKPLDNDSAEVTDAPIIKSTLSLDITNMGDVDYSMFFTVDSTLWRVVLVINSVIEWSGYVTPESYSNNSEYRSAINLVARDNLGQLEQTDYTWFEYDFVSLKELTTKACELVSWNFKPIFYNTDIISSDGTNIHDAKINTEAFRDKTWWEVLSDVLTSFGCQLMFQGENQWYVRNISLFAEKSIPKDRSKWHTIGDGMVTEITPAWKELIVKQDYQAIKEIAIINPTESNFAKADILSKPNTNPVQFYKILSGDIQGDPLFTMLMINQFRLDDKNRDIFKDKLFLMLANNTQDPNAYVRKLWNTNKTDNKIKITISVRDVLFSLTKSGNNYSIMPAKTVQGYEWYMNFIVVLHASNGKTLYLYDTGFEESNSDKNEIITFIVSIESKGVISGLLDKSFPGEGKDLDFNIILNKIPYDGTLELKVLRITGDDLSGDGKSKDKFIFAVYNFIKLSHDQDIKKGLETKINITPNARNKQDIELLYGELPAGSNSLLYAGGLYKNTTYKPPLTQWRRKDNIGGIMPLHEIIGRIYSLNYGGFRTIAGELSGGKVLRGKFEMSNLKINDIIHAADDLYVINSASFQDSFKYANLTFRQVRKYTHEAYSVVTAPIDTGSGAVIGGGGNNLQIAWSSQAANSKRIYELGTATDSHGMYLLVDKPGNNEAQKIPLAQLGIGKHASTHHKDGADAITPKSIEAISADNISIEAPIKGELNENNDLALSHAEVLADNDGEDSDMADKWGHVKRTPHPYGGDKGTPLTASEIEIFRKLFSNDFNPGFNGFAFTQDEWGRWLLEVDRIVARESLTVPEFIKNRITVANNQTWFTDNGIVETVAEVSGNAGQRIITIAEDKGGACTFQLDDLLKGIYLDEIDGGLSFQTVRMTVLEVITPYALRVSVDESTPPPREELIIVRTGNRTNPERQNSIFMDGARPAMFYYVNVDSHLITERNIAHATGNLRGLNFGELTGNLPIQERFSSIMRGDNYIAGHLVQMSGNGLEYPLPADRGAWIDIPMNGGVRRCYHYDRVSHNGSMWDCAVAQTTAEPSEIASDWTKRVAKGGDGAQGPQGVPGAPGADGQVLYTWIKYSDTATGDGISNSPTGKKYIGMAYNKATATESNTPGDYTWSLIQGPKGDTGVPGAPGADGQPTYTWIKYSDNADGTGLYDTPKASTEYIGIAVNKTVAAESSVKTDYAWSKFKGDNGLNGINGKDGKDGLSVVWQGDLHNPPANPQKNWAYRDTDNGVVYIYNGTGWAMMVADGSDGSDGAKGNDGNSVFITYHDNPTTSKPAKPTGNGTTGGWHTAPSSTCVWMSQKVALTATAGEWGEPIQIQGDGIGNLVIKANNLVNNSKLITGNTNQWGYYYFNKSVYAPGTLKAGKTYICGATTTSSEGYLTLMPNEQHAFLGKPFTPMVDVTNIVGFSGVGLPFILEDFRIYEGQIDIGWQPSLADVKSDYTLVADNLATTKSALAEAAANAKTDAAKKALEGQISELDKAKANLDSVYTKALVDGKITQSEQSAIDLANRYTLAQRVLAESTSAAYADGVVTAEEQRAIADATAKAEAARVAATAAAQDMVDAIEIGGVNLVNNSKYINGATNNIGYYYFTPDVYTPNTLKAGKKYIWEGNTLAADSILTLLPNEQIVYRGTPFTASVDVTNIVGFSGVGLPFILEDFRIYEGQIDIGWQLSQKDQDEKLTNAIANVKIGGVQLLSRPYSFVDNGNYPYIVNIPIRPNTVYTYQGFNGLNVHMAQFNGGRVQYDIAKQYGVFITEAGETSVTLFFDKTIVPTLVNSQLLVKLEEGNKPTAWSQSTLEQQKARLYQGVYMPGRSYQNNIYRQDIVKYGSAWYKYIGIDGQVQGFWNSASWEPFGASFDSVATGLLLSEEANIANFHFRNEKMVSQAATQGVPNLTLDGTNGYIKALNGEVGIFKVSSDAITVDGAGGNKILLLPDNITSVQYALSYGDSTNIPPTLQIRSCAVDLVTLDHVVQDSASSAVFTASKGMRMTFSLSGYLSMTHTGRESGSVEVFLSDANGVIAIYSFLDIGTSTQFDEIKTFTFANAGSYKLVVKARAEIKITVPGPGAYSVTALINPITINFESSNKKNMIAPNGIALVQSSNQYAVITGDIYEVRNANGGLKVDSGGTYQYKSGNWVLLT